MPRISVSTTIAATPEQVYGYVEDHANTVKYVHGITSWTPVGDQVHGLGSTFTAQMQVGPSTLDSTLQITTAEPGKELSWVPTAGFKQSGAWRFRADGAGTRTDFEVDITFPGGLAGKVFGKTVEPAIRANVKKTVENLKTQVEAQAG